MHHVVCIEGYCQHDCLLARHCVAHRLVVREPLNCFLCCGNHNELFPIPRFAQFAGRLVDLVVFIQHDCILCHCDCCKPVSRDIVEDIDPGAVLVVRRLQDFASNLVFIVDDRPVFPQRDCRVGRQTSLIVVLVRDCHHLNCHRCLRNCSRGIWSKL